MTATARLVVLATGDLAIPTLEALVEAGYVIDTIVSQPQRDDGEETLPEEKQGRHLTTWAEARGIEVRRPSDPNADSVRDKLAAASPDIGVMIAYGRSFPMQLMAVPKRGWIKVHFSLLPKNRGLHPIRSTLWNGEKKAGVSVIEVIDAADAGAIYGQEPLDIEATETFDQLAERLSATAPALATKVLATLVRGKKPKGKPQNEKAATTTPRFSQRHRTAPWWKEAQLVYFRLRALTPEPGMTTMIRHRKIRIVAGKPTEWVQAPFGETGTFLGVRSGRLAVLCSGGTVFGISRVAVGSEQKVMNGSQYARTEDLKAGDLFI